jgi:hypothetical protein
MTHDQSLLKCENLSYPCPNKGVNEEDWIKCVAGAVFGEVPMTLTWAIWLVTIEVTKTACTGMRKG